MTDGQIDSGDALAIVAAVNDAVAAAVLVPGWSDIRARVDADGCVLLHGSVPIVVEPLWYEFVRVCRFAVEQHAVAMAFDPESGVLSLTVKAKVESVSTTVRVAT